MASDRRHRSPWLIVAALAASIGLQGTVAVLYEVLRPVPPPKLFVHLEGAGDGTIVSADGRVRCDPERTACVVDIEAGEEITLSALLGQQATFEGWRFGDEEGACAETDFVLECAFTATGDTHVYARFGVIPEQVEVAMVEMDDDLREQEMKITLPGLELEPELFLPLAPEPPEPEPPPELAQQPPPDVAPEPPTPAPEEAPPEIERTNLKSVEVPDDNVVDEAPDDAQFLSDQNRDVAEQTHATETNLEREAEGERVASKESDVESDEIGGEKDEIFQLQETEPTTLDDRPEEAPHSGEDQVAVGALPGDDGADGDDGQGGMDDTPRPTGVLSMRGIEGRGAPGGPSVAERPDESRTGKAGRRGERGERGIKTQLDQDDYKRIVGDEVAQQEVELGKRRQSARRGRWEQKLGAIQSSLENFTPEVRPGNQTALKTRAAPFAVYIARMHRRIHELWGFGFLEDLNDKSASNPMNDWKLWTRIEIVIDPDGSVHKTTIVRPSGLLTFDVAALDVVLTAAPYEETPGVIRSPDGKVYMHWDFHRDWRQCGTFGVQPFILSEARAADRDRGMDDGDIVRAVPRRQRGEEGGGAAGGGRAHDHDHDHDHGDPAASARAHASMPTPDDPAAEHTANLWLTGFTRGDLVRMVGVSAAPFSSGGAVVANSQTEISRVYKLILEETGSRVIRDWRLMSAAGYRKRFGALPPGFETGTDRLLMVVSLQGERFTLELRADGAGEYKVVGFHR